MNINQTKIIGVAPRALRENGCGLFCYKCKIDLGEVHGNQNLNEDTIKNANEHCMTYHREIKIKNKTA